jgi:hypothetical protein
LRWRASGRPRLQSLHALLQQSLIARLPRYRLCIVATRRARSCNAEHAIVYLADPDARELLVYAGALPAAAAAPRAAGSPRAAVAAAAPMRAPITAGAPPPRGSALRCALRVVSPFRGASKHAVSAAADCVAAVASASAGSAAFLGAAGGAPLRLRTIPT